MKEPEQRLAGPGCGGLEGRGAGGGEQEAGAAAGAGGGGGGRLLCSAETGICEMPAEDTSQATRPAGLCPPPPRPGLSLPGAPSGSFPGEAPRGGGGVGTGSQTV